MTAPRVACTVVVKPGREDAEPGRHPWIFKGSIARVMGYQAPGDPCAFTTQDGAALGWGYVNTRSLLAGRIVSLGGPVTRRLLRDRLGEAVAARAALGLGDGGPLGAGGEERTDCYRLVNSEGDGLPGLIVDRYGTGLVLQFLTAGAERWRHDVIDALAAHLAPTFLYERSDSRTRTDEGLEAARGLLSGALTDPVLVRENGLVYETSPEAGHKTGLYLDQRENRALVGTLARDRRVLNCFAYTGGFSMAAAAGGAENVVSVDASKSACAAAERNLRRNGFPEAAGLVQREDVFRFLRPGRDRYDLVILDPPKFARSQRELDGAERGYREINRLGVDKLAPGGLLLTFSCSQAMNLLRFQQTVQESVLAAGRRARVLRRLSAGPDHPWLLGHREGEYLKGLLLLVN